MNFPAPPGRAVSLAQSIAGLEAGAIGLGDVCTLEERMETGQVKPQTPRERSMGHANVFATVEYRDRSLRSNPRTLEGLSP